MQLSSPQYICSKGRLLDLSRPIVMGILNATPNSFYNKGKDSDLQGILNNAAQMIADGATILDVGGASSKPGEPIINAEIECQRILPVIDAIKQKHPDVWLSVDTYHATTAAKAINAGADIVNDISSGDIDNDMIATVASLGVPYVAMHMQGIPENMQKQPTYNDVLQEVLQYLKNKIQICEQAGIKDIIIDPGFGFGKTIAHNFTLLQYMSAFSILDKPILAGLSRKSLICRTLNIKPEEALNGTTALNIVALQQGAAILRVHDVKEAQQVVQLFNQFNY